MATDTVAQQFLCFLSGTLPARFLSVQTASQPQLKETADLVFHCEHCKSALVTSPSAAGMNLPCQRCGKLTPVPKQVEKPADAATQLQEVQRKLKENESQHTEVTGYINQLQIQLHRWQLRLQTLNERKQQLEKDQRDAGPGLSR